MTRMASAFRFFWFGLMVAMAITAASDARGEPAMYTVGRAKVDITPDYPIRLAGYASRNREVAKVTQRLAVRAIAIGDADGKQPVVVVNVETCGFPSDLVAKVCREIQRKTGIPRERVAVCSTHVHSAPWVLGYAPFISQNDLPPDQVAHMKRFRSELESKIVDAVVQSVATLQPATLEWGRGRVDFAANRRVLQNGQWKGFGVQPDGPTDHRLPILVARDRDGKPIAVLMDYACHCTTLGGDYMEIAGDWAGFAQEMVEEDNPGATAMVIIGCGADANPEPRGEFEFCRAHGEKIRQEVRRLMSGKLKPVSGEIRCRFDTIPLPLGELPDREAWKKEVEQGGARGHWAQYFLKMLDAGQPLPDHVDYPIGTWCFGDSFAMVFLGGEVVVDYAIRMDREFDSERVWIVAYANDVPCYIPSKRILREGGYEADYSMVYYGKPTRFAPEAEDRIFDAVQRLLPHEYYSKEKQKDLPPPRDPQAALKSIHVPSDLRVELVACEPLIVDPVAFDWGPDGSLWVVEMRDYPNGMDGHGKPGGRIKRLRDTDGDGRYDDAVVFADGLVYPTGVKVWRDGILVTAAPEIILFADKDGDGRAEYREVLYRGFGEGNQQHRVNGLRFGLDNWLYVGNGESGGEIQSLRTGKKVAVRGRDLRIKPDSGELETQSGQTQYGRCQDDWGNWFGGNNSLPMWHYVLEDRYLSRNPHLRVSGFWRQICDPPGAAPVYPASRTLARFNDFDKVNRFTSACSPVVYRDQLLGEEYAGNVFICEPVHDLVFRGRMEEDGYSFRVTRPREQQRLDFFASEDNWSRPAMVRTGPDGALWVADMYRFVIEHPEWIPAEWQRRLDVRAGDNRGRIYRIVPAHGGPREFPRLSDQSPEEWVRALASLNSWTREMAQQMLLWRAKTDVVPLLQKMATTDSLPQARLHALYTLSGLGALDETIIISALQDKHPAVVRHALRLAEPLLESSANIRNAVLSLTDPDDAQLRMQLAYTLGECSDDAASTRLGSLLARHGNDTWFRRAALSSLRADNVASVVESAMAASETTRSTLYFDLLEQAAAFGNTATVSRLCESIVFQGTNGEQRLLVAAQCWDAVARSRRSATDVLQPAVRKKLDDVAVEAAKIAANPSASLAARKAAIAMLGRNSKTRESDIQTLSELLQPQVDQALQRAAVQRMAALGDARIPPAMLADWRGLSPGVRDQILDAMFGRGSWMVALVDALEDGTVAVADLGAARVSMLLNAQDRALRQRAATLIGQTVTSDRAHVVTEQLARVRGARGDTGHGKVVFEKRCSSCHKLEGVGHSVGADLMALTDRSTEALLTAVLDPNRALEDRFQSYVLATTDGRVLSGMLLAESANSITIVEPDARTHVVLRTEIERMASTGKSLMPEGLEKDLSSQDLSDVIRYVQSFTPKPKQFDGNEPQPAPVRDDGSFRLFAIHARIYGPTLVFEPHYRNLGWWQSAADWAAWDVDVRRAGKYRVYAIYACDPSVAGNRFLMRIGGQSLTGSAESTGSWDQYAGRSLGTVELEEGRQEAVIRSDGLIQGALWDLQVIRLIPVAE